LDADCPLGFPAVHPKFILPFQIRAPTNRAFRSCRFCYRKGSLSFTSYCRQ